jgi:hypothetical protein
MTDSASYRAGLEAAAQWHKAEADRLFAEHERNPAAFPMEWVNHHLSDAAAIRALPAPAAPADDEALVEEVVKAFLTAGHPAAQREAVRIALSAARAALVPDGWKLVPIKPSEAMLSVGRAAYLHGEGVEDVYVTMLAAAPTQGGGDE